MKYRIVPVKNIGKLATAGKALIDRGLGMPGMGMVWGHTGYGKTTAITWFINQCNGVYVRALAAWSPTAMLRAILRELDIEPIRQHCSVMVEQIVRALAESGRPLFIDEADYVVEDRKMVETLRDLHDMSSVPVVLIGMAGIQRKIHNRQQLTGRIAQWVEFGPCDLDDARAIAEDCCEVTVEEDLLTQLHRKSSGAIRLLVVGLARIESRARALGLDRIGLSQWKKGEDFFIGDAPRISGGDQGGMKKAA